MDHHPGFGVLQAVAVKDMVLIAGVGVREVQRNPHRLSGPDMNGVEHAAVLRQQAACAGQGA